MVLDPLAILCGAEQIVAVEPPGRVDAEAGVAIPELRVVVRNRETIVVDDEHIPLTVNIFRAVVVVDRRLQTFPLVPLYGISYQ